MVSARWASLPLVKPLIQVRKKIRALSPVEYSLLHAIDFRHRVESEILPALWTGKTVLADRYLFTALARDAARGLELDWLLQAYAPLLWPDLVLYFAMPTLVAEPARRGDAASALLRIRRGCDRHRRSADELSAIHRPGDTGMCQ